MNGKINEKMEFMKSTNYDNNDAKYDPNTLTHFCAHFFWLNG